jgi:hypothetical protein
VSALGTAAAVGEPDGVPEGGAPRGGAGAPELGQLLDVVGDGGPQRLEPHPVAPAALRPPQPVALLEFGVRGLDRHCQIERLVTDF